MASPWPWSFRSSPCFWSGDIAKRSPDWSGRNRDFRVPAKLFGYLRHHQADFTYGGMIEQGLSVRLQVHPLTHPYVRERVSGRKCQNKTPVENVAIAFAANRPDDIVSRSFVTMLIDSPDLP